MKPQNRERSIAYHEAAHAVIAAQIGAKVAEVTIVGRVVRAGVMNGRVSAAFKDPGASRRSRLAAYRKLAIVAWSGAEAEFRHGTSKEVVIRGFSDDEKALRRLSRQAFGSTNLSWINSCRKQSYFLVAKHWASIKAVARELIKWKTLSGFEVWMIVLGTVCRERNRVQNKSRLP